MYGHRPEMTRRYGIGLGEAAGRGWRAFRRESSLVEQVTRGHIIVPCTVLGQEWVSGFGALTPTSYTTPGVVSVSVYFAFPAAERRPRRLSHRLHNLFTSVVRYSIAFSAPALQRTKASSWSGPVGQSVGYALRRARVVQTVGAYWT